MFKKINKEFGSNIYKIRTENYMNQEQFARFINKNLQTLDINTNYDNKTISKWENGDCMPDTHVVVGLSKILDVSLDILMKGTVDLIASNNLFYQNLYTQEQINKCNKDNKTLLLYNWGERKYGIMSYFVDNIDIFCNENSNINVSADYKHFTAPIGYVKKTDGEYKVNMINTGSGEIKKIAIENFSQNNNFSDYTNKRYYIYTENDFITLTFSKKRNDINLNEKQEIIKAVKKYCEKNNILDVDEENILSEIMFNEINYLEFQLGLVSFEDSITYALADDGTFCIFLEAWINLTENQIIKMKEEEYACKLKRELDLLTKDYECEFFQKFFYNLDEDRKKDMIKYVKKEETKIDNIYFNTIKTKQNNSQLNLNGNKRTLINGIFGYGEKPKAFFIYGKYCEVNNQNDMLLQLMEILYNLEPSIINRLANLEARPGNCRTAFISYNPDAFHGRAYKEIGKSNIFILTNLNISQKLQFIKLIIKEYNFSENDFYYIV